MSRDKERRLVDVLAERTKSRTLDWKPAIGNDAYLISFSDSSIVIATDMTTSNTAVFMEITNSSGEVVDRFDGEELERGLITDRGKWVRKLQEIHNGARRSVLKADVILESILERLEH